MIGHGRLLKAFSSARLSRGSTPRHAQTAGDLGFAVQFNAGISHSSAILGSDNPQRNNRKGNSIHSPCERPNVIKHAIADYLRLQRPTTQRQH